MNAIASSRAHRTRLAHAREACEAEMRCTSLSATLPPDREHLNYEVAAEDPKTFSRVWRMSMALCGHTEPNFQVLEYDCHAMTPSSTN